ncbi:MAG: 4Fe-4S binding protein, partial [Deltaproteobacteria bacterium]|nr:4Fe-4S binding protein [Deltaproteobacteria bacterium]
MGIGFSWAREWVYPEAIKGRFQRTHRWTSLGLHLFLFLTPWVNIRGQPAFSFDLPARRLYLLGEIFTAADGVLLMLIALMATFGLFFFTSLYGRLWCGYTCPQSVFLLQWVVPIEQWLEGPRGQQMRRDKGPLTFDKAWRKLAKWALLLGLAFLVSMAFMGLFSDTRALWTGRGGP